jgi:WD40 repeat protein
VLRCSGKGGVEVLQHSHEVLALAWAPSGKRLASATLDGQIYLWDPLEAELLVSPPSPFSLPNHPLSDAFSVIWLESVAFETSSKLSFRSPTRTSLAIYVRHYMSAW